VKALSFFQGGVVELLPENRLSDSLEFTGFVESSGLKTKKISVSVKRVTRNADIKLS